MKISIVYHHFNNSEAILKRMQELRSFSFDVRKNLQLIIVDDSSDQPLSFNELGCEGLNIVYAQIIDNISWNQGGARNLGALLASGEWLLMIDVDHRINEEGLKYFLEINKSNEDCFYFLRTDGTKELKKAPNIFIINRYNFFQCGGYDEEFSGGYGYEDILFYNIRSIKLKPVLIKKMFITVDNSQSTKGLNRDTIRNENIYNVKNLLLSNGCYKNGSLLNFRWKISGFQKIED